MFAKKKKKEKKMKLRCGDPHLYLRIQKGVLSPYSAVSDAEVAVSVSKY